MKKQAKMKPALSEAESLAVRTMYFRLSGQDKSITVSADDLLALLAIIERISSGEQR